jgi:dTDP-4-dehydrorhamnose 3,5-epimerase
MKVERTALPDVLVLEPKVFGDQRGFFMESYNRRALESEAGIKLEFVQDNHSRSAKGVLRGLHYQIRQTQGKLVRVIAGAIFDVAVDIRRSSPTFGKSVSVELSAGNKRMVWIPPGFAHGFLTLSDDTEVLYKATDYYAPEHERILLWSDPEIGIKWPLEEAPLVSDKDAGGSSLKSAEVFP